MKKYNERRAVKMAEQREEESGRPPKTAIHHYSLSPAVPLPMMSVMEWMCTKADGCKITG
jgi:hypothetical protein